MQVEGLIGQVESDVVVFQDLNELDPENIPDEISL